MTGTVLVKYSCRCKLDYGCQNQATRDGYCDDCYDGIVNRNNNKRPRRVQNLSDSFDFGSTVKPHTNKTKTAKIEPSTEKKSSTKKARQRAEKNPSNKRSTSVTKQAKNDNNIESTKPVKEKIVRQKKDKEKTVKPEPPIVKSFAIPTPKCAHPNCRKRSYQDNLCEFHFNKSEGKPANDTDLIKQVKSLYEKGMPLREIAETVGISYGAIKSRIHYYTEAKYIDREKREKAIQAIKKTGSGDLDIIKELYERGVAIQEIATKVGIDYNVLRARIHRYAKSNRISKEKRAKVIKDVNKDIIKELYEKGMTIREISAIVGINFTTLRLRIRRYIEVKYIDAERRESKLAKLNENNIEALTTIKEMYESGMPIPKIAEALGLRRAQVNGKIQWYCSTGKISRKRREDNIKALNGN